jgi:hypothetical protein
MLPTKKRTMNSDQLEAAIERAGEMSREELIDLVRECKAHLDLRQRLARDILEEVARQHKDRGLAFATRNA